MNAHKDPLFLRFVARELGVIELLNIFSRSQDAYTREACESALKHPPNLEDFHQELTEAVEDIVSEGAADEFKAFVNNYMEDAITEDIVTSPSEKGENISRTARVQNADGPWVQALLCYNLCLYLKVYGTENLKKCRICGKLFAHKGKYAVYCGDTCKKRGKKVSKANEDKAEPKKKKVIKEAEPNQGINLSSLLSE